MLVTFSCKAYSDITMFGDNAKRFLTIMGHSGTIPSALPAEDIPQALSLLKKAVAEDKENNPQQQGVSFSHRALPLIELLTAAQKEQCYVTWK